MAHVNRDVAYYVQFGLLTILICGYFAFTVLDGRIVLLGVGFALFALAAGIAVKLGQSTTSGREMIIVALVASLAFFLPLSGSPPIEAGAGLAAGIGLLATEGLWALHRYPAVSEASAGSAFANVRRAVGLGLKIALGFSLLAGAIMAIGAASSTSARSEIATLAPFVFSSYFVGAIAAGTLVGVLRPLATWPLGVMLTGIVGAVLVYGAVAPVVAVSEQLEGKLPPTISEMVEIALMCGFFAGPPAAVAFKWSDARGRWRGA